MNEQTAKTAHFSQAIQYNSCELDELTSFHLKKYHYLETISGSGK